MNIKGDKLLLPRHCMYMRAEHTVRIKIDGANLILNKVNGSPRCICTLYLQHELMFNASERVIAFKLTL